MHNFDIAFLDGRERARNVAWGHLRRAATLDRQSISLGANHGHSYCLLQRQYVILIAKQHDRLGGRGARYNRWWLTPRKVVSRCGALDQLQYALRGSRNIRRLDLAASHSAEQVRAHMPRWAG